MGRLSFFAFLILSLTSAFSLYHPHQSAQASDKGSLQAQIPNINLNDVDPKIKDRCNAEAVNASGYDPDSPNNPTKSDYQKQHFEAVAQGLVEEVIYPKSYSRLLQRKRESSMKNDLKARSDRAQGYVKAYRSCLEINWPPR